jgi:hypothetical protein
MAALNPKPDPDPASSDTAEIVNAAAATRSAAQCDRDALLRDLTRALARAAAREAWALACVDEQHSQEPTP